MFIVLGFIVFIMLYPFVYMIAVSLSDSISILQNKVTFYPKGFNLTSYKIVFRDPRIFTAYKNTIIYVAVGTLISLAFTGLAAYALSKKDRLIGAKFFNILILVTMFFSGGMIPKYLVVKDLGILNTTWAVILPSAISAWNLIIMRSFFDEFPKDIEDSGRIDGLNDYGVLWYLVLPTSGAVLSTIGLFYAVSIWNSFMEPFLYLQDKARFPLQVILRDIVLLGSNFDNQAASAVGDSVVIEDSLKFATIIVSVVPIIAVYPYIQKYFVKGVMIGSIKG
ncbi:MAG: carbohydrate ABC transporter permease [Epulopiscium sp.]|nr:carbohydrate ABC transporter permease [Candidatus Epulonipiscium sp.]